MPLGDPALHWFAAKIKTNKRPAARAIQHRIVRLP
jgi:hypothetical protein